MNLAVIPARGGSKRIPRKNIKCFCGKPIIAWSIEAAIISGCFDRVIVSTDDAEIADVAKKYGAEVPFLRPDNLADDYIGTIPVVRHAIEQIAELDGSPEFVCCLYATAPFVIDEDIREGYRLLQDSGADYTISVTSYAFPIQRAIRVTEQGRVEMFFPEYMDTRSQDLQESWHDAGQFYWGRADAWREERKIFSSSSLPVVLPRYRVQDIDSPEDWIHAELMFKALRSATQRKVCGDN